MSDAIGLLLGKPDDPCYSCCFLGHIQIDDPILVSFCDEKLRQLMLKEGVDPEALLDTYIRVLNGCIADKPSDLLASVHICRGNVRVR